MARRRFVVAYDICDSTRLRRVHKTMKAFGYALQYSVFICDLDPSEKITMVQEVGDIINHHQDSIAIIDVGEADRRGRECFEFMGTNRNLPVSGPQVF